MQPERVDGDMVTRKLKLRSNYSTVVKEKEVARAKTTLVQMRNRVVDLRSNIWISS